MRQLSISSFLFFPALAYGQEAVKVVPTQYVEGTDYITRFITGPHFFIALIAGVVLAVAFELILTNLSLAAGLNVLGTVTTGRKTGYAHPAVGEEPGAGFASTVRKITGAFGAWTLVTASIALFFASWLAVELSLTPSLVIGAIIGLVIWGLFYVAMMTLETSALASLVGSLGGIAVAGLRSAYKLTNSLFTKSPEQRVADATAKVAATVRQEIFGDTDLKDIREELHRFAADLRPQWTPTDIRKEIEMLLDETELHAITKYEGEVMDEPTIIATLQRNPTISKEQAKSIASGISGAVGKIKEEAQSDKGKTEKVTDAAMRMAGISEEDSVKYRTQFENYLRSTNKDELNPEGIKRDIEKLFSDPSAGFEALKRRFSAFDKDTITKLIAGRKDIPEQDARRITDNIANTFASITQKAQQGKGEAAGSIAGIQDKIMKYLGSIKKPDLDYTGIKNDFTKLFSDPKVGADALLRRLKSVDRDTIKSLLAGRKDISEADADRIIDQIETTRDSLIHKAQQMKDEVSRRVTAVKEEAIHEADEVRKTAATAAWWSFASAVVSGIAAAFGGMVAAMTRGGV